MVHLCNNIFVSKLKIRRTHIHKKINQNERLRLVAQIFDNARFIVGLITLSLTNIFMIRKDVYYIYYIINYII